MLSIRMHLRVSNCRVRHSLVGFSSHHTAGLAMFRSYRSDGTTIQRQLGRALELS
jgi:hypothetical protein